MQHTDGGWLISIILVTLPPTITAVASLVINVINHFHLKSNSEQISRIEIRVNGRLDQLLAQAKKEGQEEEKLLQLNKIP